MNVEVGLERLVVVLNQEGLVVRQQNRRQVRVDQRLGWHLFILANRLQRGVLPLRRDLYFPPVAGVGHAGLADLAALGSCAALDFENDAELGALVYLRVNEDFAAHLLNQRLANAEAQAPAGRVFARVHAQVVEVDEEAL